MTKLYILHENNDWMAPIRLALHAEIVKFEELYLADRGLIDLTSALPQGVYFNRMSPSSHIANVE